MPGRLNNKVAIVTGGSAGIGRGIVKVFVDEGAKVVVSARNEQKLADTLKEINSNNLIAIKCDVINTNEVKNLINTTVKKFGKLDIVINNAGKNGTRPFTIEDTTEEEWDEFQTINAKGAFLVSKYSIPELRKAGGGSIVMISSIYANLGYKNCGCYSSSKAAMEGLVRGMAVDLARDNIRVNAIRPGYVIVDSLKKGREKDMDQIISLHPIGRLGIPEDIAWAAVYLSSDESTWVTGALFAIDGGYAAI
ncbi:MAG: SDR family NAD(P)-dependent oxidoreductase [Candidatus Humimicrobiaceae bacterium]